MFDLSQNGLSHDEAVKRLTEAHRRDDVNYRIDILRGGVPITTARYDQASIECNGESEVKYTGRFRIKDNPLINWETDYLRPVMFFDSFEFPLIPLKPITNSREIESGITYYNIEAYDKSIMLQENSIGEILFIESGTLYTAFVSKILEPFGEFNIEPSSLFVSADREDWEESDFILTIINQLLEEINYLSLAVDREGVFYAKKYIEPSIRSATIHYDAKSGIVYPLKAVEIDSYKRPNRFVGIAFNPDMEEKLTFEYVNNDPSIPTSTSRQGYVRTAILQYNHIADRATLEEIVLREASEVARSYEHTNIRTAIMPHHSVFDVMTLNTADALGVYEEVGWSIDMFGKSGVMTHNLRRLTYD